MLFKEFGSKSAPVFIALHGGGLSWWALQKVVDLLKADYHVVVPVIDGHGEDYAETFISIQDSAQKLIQYINHNFNGQVFALSGLSIGAQIVTEMLSACPSIAKYAFIESALVYPMKSVSKMARPMFELSYGLIKKRWFSKMQAKATCIPDEMFEQYFKDSAKISKQSLMNITLSNGNYSLRQSISGTKSKVLIIAGEREMGIMKKSAQLLHETIKGSELYIAKAMKHGEMDLRYPEQFVELAKGFIHMCE